jgi:hypothetical protein
MKDKNLKNSTLRAFLKGFASAFDITGGIKMPDLTTGRERDGAVIRGDPGRRRYAPRHEYSSQ